jgi:hypothetical protein
MAPSFFTAFQGNSMIDYASKVSFGTHGELGSELLAQLLEHPSVHKIYALNRTHKDSKTPKGRQGDGFGYRGIKASLLESSKLLLLERDTSETHLGLEEGQFFEVRCCGEFSGNF